MSEQLVYNTRLGNGATNSVLVARKFGKRHDNVLRTVERVIRDVETANAALLKSEETHPVPVEQLFYETQYLDSQGKPQRAYQISRKGFQVLAMRFTGAGALAFQLEFLAAFERLQLENQQLKQQAQAAAATEQVARLAQYTSVDKQIACVKQVAGKLIHAPGQHFALIHHHRAVMKALTGQRPSAYVEAAVQAGHKVRGKSGRHVLRQLEPAKAATAAVMDEATAQGKSLDQMQQAGVLRALPAAFEAILRLGLQPAELRQEVAA